MSSRASSSWMKLHVLRVDVGVLVDEEPKSGGVEVVAGADDDARREPESFHAR